MGKALGIAVSVLKWTGIVVGGVLAVLVLGFVLVPPATRWFTDSWGATDSEVNEKLPGDDLFPAERELSTKAISIDAPPSAVYALVQQMGQHRAGWYGWDWFYNATNSSDFVDGHYSTRIVPELQNVKVGDKISINDMVAYEVMQADGEVLILAVGSIDLPATRDTLPDEWSENSMAWIVRPEGEGTRLILRMRADGSETGFGRWVWSGPLNFGGALFSRKTMAGIKRVAESLAQ